MILQAEKENLICQKSEILSILCLLVKKLLLLELTDKILIVTDHFQAVQMGSTRRLDKLKLRT